MDAVSFLNTRKLHCPSKDRQRLVESLPTAERLPQSAFHDLPTDGPGPKKHWLKPVRVTAGRRGGSVRGEQQGMQLPTTVGMYASTPAEALIEDLASRKE